MKTHQLPGGKSIKVKCGTQHIDRCWRFIKERVSKGTHTPASFASLRRKIRSAQYEYWHRGADMWMHTGEILSTYMSDIVVPAWPCPAWRKSAMTSLCYVCSCGSIREPKTLLGLSMHLKLLTSSLLPWLLNESKNLNVFFAPCLFNELKTLHAFIVPYLLNEPKNLHVFTIVPWLPISEYTTIPLDFSSASYVLYLKFSRISGSGTICYIQTNMRVVTKLSFNSTTTWKR